MACIPCFEKSIYHHTFNIHFWTNSRYRGFTHFFLLEGFDLKQCSQIFPPPSPNVCLHWRAQHRYITPFADLVKYEDINGFDVVEWMTAKTEWLTAKPDTAIQRLPRAYALFDNCYDLISSFQALSTHCSHSKHGFNNILFTYPFSPVVSSKTQKQVSKKKMAENSPEQINVFSLRRERFFSQRKKVKNPWKTHNIGIQIFVKNPLNVNVLLPDVVQSPLVAAVVQTLYNRLHDA